LDYDDVVNDDVVTYYVSGIYGSYVLDYVLDYVLGIDDDGLVSVWENNESCFPLYVYSIQRVALYLLSGKI
jgi:hypothetical protein